MEKLLEDLKADGFPVDLDTAVKNLDKALRAEPSINKDWDILIPKCCEGCPARCGKSTVCMCSLPMQGQTT